ncbi:hypothetical protein J0A67_20120 [Algoriphagus aestuariicola]|uniref:Peptidase M56 domain-containing protein n=1 Tax=Algoriphagus aestuariicola TaxID=1852016 RepID=A0ABS3BV94_9BACT|nr:M56 family metallopeptidase [Algoriphagus aestuariicola]MBN7803192.1 hypothetical protein [Algoriphagus aestuariicola]
MDYLLKSILCLLVLLLIHRVMLQREVLHRFNRFFLLAAVPGSFLIPLYTIKVPVEKTEPLVFEAALEEENEAGDYENFAGVEDVENVITGMETTTIEPQVSESQFPWQKVAWTVYMLISGLFLFRFFRNLMRLLYQIRRNPKLPYRGETLVLHTEKTPPFSFLNYIFVSRPSFEKDGISDAVFAHERCHVRERHSWDVLLVEALMVPFWFHPGLYLARHAIQLNHEFIADQAALGTTPVQEYQQLLLGILSANSSSAMVSSLNFSLTKKRMQMMNKKPNSPLRWLKLLVLVPVIGALVYFFGEKVEVQPEEAVVAEVQTPATENPVERVETNIRIISDRVVEVDGESVPIEELSKWLDEIKASQPIVRISADPGVEMGALADVQEMLRGMEMRRVIYDGQGSTGLQSEKDVYYRNATFFVEDSKGLFVRRDYGELSSEEKSYLVAPAKSPAYRTPTPEMLTSLKNAKEYAIWLNAEPISNNEVASHEADIVFYFSSFFPISERTANYPQAYKIRMFTKKGYEETFGAKSGFATPLVEDDIFYLYPLTKRVNYGRTITKSNQSPIDMYLRLYDSYASEFEGKGDDDLSEWQQAIGWQLFTELGGRYYRLSAANKKMVPRAKRPEFQYWVPLMKDGVRYYKKQNELTEEEKKQLPPPPPPPSKSEGDFDPNPSEEKQVVAAGNKWGEAKAYTIVYGSGFQSNALKEYLTRYGQFQTKAYENHGFSQKSDWEIEALRLDFDRLVRSYERLTNDERRNVQRATFPYAKIEKDGKTIYKKFADLTEQERKELSC